MSAHTPGPWAVQVAEPIITSHATAYEIVTDDFDVVGGRVGIRSAADACLIAAAPDVYEALEALVELERGDLVGEQFKKALLLALRRSDVVLAKARGEGAKS